MIRAGFRAAVGLMATGVDDDVDGDVERDPDGEGRLVGRG